jgi:hydrophobic/amphiphilic exporter-1 (mainly G- bacteria), HAE1 family
MSIPRIAIQRPVTMFMISAIIILIGVISLTRLPVDLLPDVSNPSISVRVNYPNVGPLEIEELITRPIEQSVSAVAGLERVNSTSSEGSANIRLNFAWGTDLSEAADDVRTRLDRVRGRLPEDADPPTIFKFDSTASPIMGVGVESDGSFDLVSLREFAEQTLSQRLERVPGVASVNIEGGLRRQIHVDLSREKITALNLPVNRVVSLLRLENQNLPLGEITEGDYTYLLRSEGQFATLDDIRNLVVMTRQNVPVYLRDVAEVSDSTEDRRSFLRINGKPGIRMRVTKQSGTNTVEVADGVIAEIARINAEQDNVKLSVLDNSSIFIRRSIDNVKEHAMIGGVLVILIIFAFLRDFRSTLIVCTSLPISIIGTFALMYFGGFTLNTMTFGGLALGTGMIVDAAIVVLENTYRHMEHGKDRVTASIEGSEEVWSAIVASTLTHIAVFFPLLFLTGVSSVLFKQLSVVVIFSLTMSLFVAVTIVPVLCAKVLKLPAPADQRRGLSGRLFTWSERTLDRMDNGYRAILHTSLKHRPTVLAIGGGLFVIAMLMLSTIGFELMPQTDEGEVNVTAELPIGTRVERTEAVMLRLEDWVRQNLPEARMTIINGGGGGGFGPGGGGGFRGTLNIKLVPKDDRKRSNDQIAQDLRRQLTGILPGVTIRANVAGGNQQLNQALGGNQDARLALEIRGHDLSDAKRLAQEALRLMQTTRGIADARIGRDEGRPERAILVDRPKAALLGLGYSDIATTLQTNVQGTRAASFRERGTEYPIVVRLREEDRNRIADVNDVLLSTPQGQVLPAKNVLSLEAQSGPVQIERKNEERITTINAQIETTLSTAVSNVTRRLGELNIPKDFTVGFGADVEEQEKSFRQLQMMLILAIILVYAVMASQYESLRDPFIIMFSVPMAAIGVVMALKLTGTAFNLQGYIGVIMLAGIVVSNAILLVDYTNTLRRRDQMELREAVEVAGRTRLRPILMTSIATMLGLVPMSLGIGEGSELQAPLARVVIGGLLTSTMITLVFVPTVYTLFEEGLAGLRGKHGEPKQA